ncbi:Growth/differentiation factor 10 [Dissostichus eleginoides]|uniref:Growth/differentiation factor 10 n=1 Tax=Dissostichus eleginoides TaxID=100907 RepID=A0AAD9CSR7_DISEL|nr:Growth/differentiation factor 10 [Dissostichus eleginoides]
MAALRMKFSHLFMLMLNCFLHGAASVKIMRGRTQDSSFFQPSLDMFSDDPDQDMVSHHMSKLYEKYNRENRLKEGNTVRSFRASQDSSDRRTVYRLNLTTLQDSEVILSATFHFLLDRLPHQKPWFCKRFKSPSCRSSAIHPSPSISLLLRSVSSGSEVRSGSMGSLLGNVTFHPHRRGVWQMKDVTQVIKEARDKGHLLVSVELGQQHQRKPEGALSGGSLPYLLLYANDQALAEPNSVAASLQRYDPFGEGGEPSLTSNGPNSSPEPKGRERREATAIFDPILNNELPQVLKEEEKPQQELKPDDSTKKKLKDSRNPTTSDGRKHERRHEGKDGKKHKGSTHSESPVLSFDEQTMRKARRRQWGDTQQRGCSRRNLRVDFADIGWSEWVIEPKAFDAYYCAGTCGFPMSKVARPSNHATIQSIVRAVGIIPGVPEPCCVPEKMSPLAVLYQDESRNPVLKVYPNMSVQSCSCR